MATTDVMAINIVPEALHALPRSHPALDTMHRLTLHPRRQEQAKPVASQDTTAPVEFAITVPLVATTQAMEGTRLRIATRVRPAAIVAQAQAALVSTCVAALHTTALLEVAAASPFQMATTRA